MNGACSHGSGATGLVVVGLDESGADGPVRRVALAARVSGSSVAIAGTSIGTGAWDVTASGNGEPVDSGLVAAGGIAESFRGCGGVAAPE